MLSTRIVALVLVLCTRARPCAARQSEDELPVFDQSLAVNFDGSFDHGDAPEKVGLILSAPELIVANADENNSRGLPRPVVAPSAAQDKLMELISTITGYIALLPDGGLKFLETLIRNERGFGRALLITNVETMLRNILGDRPRFRISDWNSKNSQKETFPLFRKEPWDAGAIKTPQEGKALHPEPGKGEPPGDLFNIESLKHRDRKVVSCINMDQWNKAGWAGTGFAMSEAPGDVPYLILMFKEPKATESIFSGWRDEFGPEDMEERLRVSMVTGINSDNPAAYRVIISADPKWSRSEQTKNKQFIIVSRINEMVPRTSANLDRFLERYRKVQRYLLLPGQATKDGLGAWASSLGVLKRELIVRPAWQIGRNDPDMCGIEADDKIIIPPGVTDVPVLEALAWRKKRGETKASLSSPRGTDVASAPPRKLGRNDPCYCGSGRKYKRCHGR